MISSSAQKFEGFRVFPTAVALILMELVFAILLIGGWIMLKRVAPNVQLNHPSWWPMLLALPVSVGIFTYSYAAKQTWARRLADEGLWETALPNWKPRLMGWKFLIWHFAFAACLLGVMDVKVGARLREVKSEGIDMMLALDVSNSMEAEDLGMSRLVLAKQTIERLINQIEGDRVGLIIFAGDAYVQCPITTDYGALKLFLDGVSPALVPVQGTAVGRAIEVCQNGFDPESPASKIIVILTDGENHEDDAVAAAQTAKEKGTEVHTIGMGTTAGGPIPQYDRYGRQQGFKTDASGNPVVTVLDEGTLMQIAEAGHGTFTRAGKGMVNLNLISDSIHAMEQTEIATLTYTDYIHHFQWFFAAAILFLLLESIIGYGPVSRFSLHHSQNR